MENLLTQSLALIIGPLLGMLPLPAGMPEFIMRILESPGGSLDTIGGLIPLMITL
jgi:hypothetical protein